MTPPERSTSPTSPPPAPRLRPSRRLPDKPHTAHPSTSSALIKPPLPQLPPATDFASAAIRTPAHYVTLIRALREYDAEQHNQGLYRACQEALARSKREERHRRLDRQRVRRLRAQSAADNGGQDHGEEGEEESEEDQGEDRGKRQRTTTVISLPPYSVTLFRRRAASDTDADAETETDTPRARIEPADDHDDDDAGQNDSDPEVIDGDDDLETGEIVSSSARVILDSHGRQIIASNASARLLTDHEAAQVKLMSAMGVDTSNITVFEDTEDEADADVEVETETKVQLDESASTSDADATVALVVPALTASQKKSKKKSKNKKRREARAAQSMAEVADSAVVVESTEPVGLGLSVDIEALQQAEEGTHGTLRPKLSSPSITASSGDETAKDTGSAKEQGGADDTPVWSAPTSPAIRFPFSPATAASTLLLSDDDDDAQTIRVNLPPPRLSYARSHSHSRSRSPTPCAALQLDPVPEEADTADADDSEKHTTPDIGQAAATPELLTPAQNGDTLILPSVHIASSSASTPDFPLSAERTTEKTDRISDGGEGGGPRRILLFGSIVVGEDFDSDDSDDDEMPTQEQIEQLTSFAPRSSPQKSPGDAASKADAADAGVDADEDAQADTDVDAGAQEVAEADADADQPELIIASAQSSDAGPSTPTTPIPEPPTLAPRIVVDDPSPLPAPHHLSPPHLPGSPSPLRHELLAPSPLPQSPTTHPWSLFFSDTDKSRSSSRSRRSISGMPSAEAYSDNLVPLFSAGNLVDLFGHWKALRRQIAMATGRPIELPGSDVQRGQVGLGLHGMSDDNNFHFFVQDVKPMWEDGMCAKGGKFMFAGPCEKMDAMFFEIVLILISDDLSLHCPAPEGSGSIVVGASLARRGINTRAEIWIGGPNPPSVPWVRSVQAWMSRELGGERVYEYKSFHGPAGGGGGGGREKRGGEGQAGGGSGEGRQTPPVSTMGSLGSMPPLLPQAMPMRGFPPMGRGVGIGRTMSAVMAGEKPYR